MPRPAVYGKRTRAKFNPLGANLSSPEQPLTKPDKAPQGIHIRFDDPEHEDEVKEKKPSRKALGERNNNAVVVPLEAIEHVEKKSKKPRTRRKDEDVVPEEKPRRRKTRKEAIEALEPKVEEVVAVESVQEDVQPDEQPPEETKPSTGREQRRIIEPHEKPNTEPDIEPLPDLISSTTALDPYGQHCSSLLSLSNHTLTDFSSWSAQLSTHFSVTKIAEASFGEVYRLSLHHALPDFSSTDESVFKIIPLQAPPSSLPLDKRKRTAFLKKQETMSAPASVSSEVKLLQRMSAIPGFTNFRDVRILQGRPPEAFITAFKTWNAAQKASKKDLSHFPDPSKPSSYSADQLWAVIEMQDAGTDLERLVETGSCTSIWAIWDVFWQVVLSLAKGEEGAEFEHRDLHLGNICVRSSSPSSGPIDIDKKINFTALETTIIDYTISRCTMPASEEIAYIDLSTDPALFEGDSTEEYQYDIYRYMRSALFYDNGLAEYTPEIEADGRSWAQFHPQTNLVWLHLVLYKLLEQVAWPSAEKRKRGKGEKEERKRACALEKVLLQVQELLDPGAICANGIKSARDLVVLALSESWLDVSDVVGHGAGDESALVSQLEGLEL